MKLKEENKKRKCNSSIKLNKTYWFPQIAKRKRFSYSTSCIQISIDCIKSVWERTSQCFKCFASQNITSVKISFVLINPLGSNKKSARVCNHFKTFESFKLEQLTFKLNKTCDDNFLKYKCQGYPMNYGMDYKKTNKISMGCQSKFARIIQSKMALITPWIDYCISLYV